MNKHRFRARALHLLSLIGSFQIQLTNSLPAQATNQNTNEARDPDRVPKERPLPLEWESNTAVSYSGSYTAAGESPTGAVYEIQDGQIQASYIVSTEEVFVTSLSTTFVSSETITSYYPYTPLPRHWTPSSVSSATSVLASHSTSASRRHHTRSTRTSTTTVYVRPSKASPTSAASTQATLTTIPNTALTSLTTSEVQTAIVSPESSTSGAVQTTLETSGEPSNQPFTTVSLNSSASLSLVDTSTLTSVGPTATANITSISAGNLFQPIETNAPPPQISSRSDHPVPPLGIEPQPQRLETNKFYANFFLGDQTAATWTHPYSLSWSKGTGQSGSWGLAISHIERSQLATGSATSSDRGEWEFFANPVGIQSLVMSAVELSDGATLTTDSLEAFSVNVNLVSNGADNATITFPLVQGMGFVTGVYNDGTPLIESGVGIVNLTYVGAVIDGATYKYSALLKNGFTWLMYITPSSDGYQENSFTLLSSGAIQGPAGFGGYIQIAKVPAGASNAESVYDNCVSSYATGVIIRGSVDGTTGTYSFSWTKEGDASQPLLIFALPHHLESFDSATSARVTDVQLVTTTKGMGTAVQGDSWTLVEPDLPITMSFAPWSPLLGDVEQLSPAAIEAINIAGAVELAENISQQTNTGSMYYDGKALAKFAAIVYVLDQLADNKTLALTGLVKLEEAFDLHVNNQQDYPLVYDTVWGGAVSISTYLDGNPGNDFGNTYYNDHHFHYGYFAYAAAVIGFLDPTWLETGTNKDWVNMLVRDYGNSIADDPYFPFTRMFDWYMGHSWAEGLFESFDGKNEESSSEDTMASYGMKMWGKVINDKNMEARGNLMLAIQARSLSHYFLYLNDNVVEPVDYVGNKVSGILFENKIDHTTYFGDNVEYIEGIHMLPLMPFSPFIRSQTFVQQEWNAYGFESYVNQVQGGWRGILMANLAIIDPVTSYNFFSNQSGTFNFGLLDSGASQTWYLAFSAALGGSSYSKKE